MRRLLHIFINSFALSAIFMAAGCVKDNLLSSAAGAGEETVVSFSLRLDRGIETRAIADAGKIDQLVVAAYENSAEVLRKSIDWDGRSTVDTELRLINNRTYKVLFWAQDKDNTAYLIGKDGIISIDYKDYLAGGFGKMEELDAFYAVDDVVNGVSSSSSLILNRPIAQINFADNDSEASPVKNQDVATVALKGMATQFNALDGTVSGVSEDALTFTFTDFPEDEAIGGNEYIASIYLFPTEGVTGSYRMNDQEPLPVNQITLNANNRTNVFGSLVQTPED